jgi:2-succinyl-6-hydroxy-2,4-cyclohexadiene-1-carboxylate synthase
MSLNVLTAGSGPPVLLLHGFTGSARSWAVHIEALAADHRVIAPDLLGHAGSDAPADPAAYALERQAAGVRDLLELLEAAPAAVVGYSMGARLALVLALTQPQVVERLVLESPSPGIADERDRAARRLADEHLADEIERDGVEAFVERWAAMPIFDSQATLPADIRAAQRHERLRHTTVGLAGSLRGAGQGAMVPLHERLSAIVVPTLVVAGALDHTGCERARIVAGTIPDARLEIVAGAGHNPHLETAGAFGRLLAEFLSARQPTP